MDKEWKGRPNRIFYVNSEGLLERESDLIQNAYRTATNEVVIVLRNPVDSQKAEIQLDPFIPIKKTMAATRRKEGVASGYIPSPGMVTFYLEEDLYKLNLSPRDKVTVAGNFNEWDASGGYDGRWRLKRLTDEKAWTLTLQSAALRTPVTGQDILFKFVVNGSRWLAPPAHAHNAVPDGKGHVNLRVDRGGGSGNTTFKIITERPLALNQNYDVIIEGIWKKPVQRTVTRAPFWMSSFPVKCLVSRSTRSNKAPSTASLRPALKRSC